MLKVLIFLLVWLLAPTPFFDLGNIDHKDIEIIRDAVQTKAVKSTQEELPQTVIGTDFIVTF